MRSTEPRSWLFVPGDSDRKLAKAGQVGADALVLDLEDSVAPDRKEAARLLSLDFLKTEAPQLDAQCWVRINPVSTEQGVMDLMNTLQGEPAGVMLPKAQGASDLDLLIRHLEELEREYGLILGQTRIVVIATETPAAVLSLGEYARHRELRRLQGLTWGAEDLAAALGASSNRDAEGHWTHPYQMARSLALLAARAAGVQPIDTLHADFKDNAGLRASCAEARRDGFTGKLAIHPDQVGAINEAFLPTEEELVWARKVVAAFDQQPGAGVLSLDGNMVDKPHLQQAQRLIDRAKFRT